MVAIGGYFACASILVSRRNFCGAGYEPDARERRFAEPGDGDNGSARRGNTGPRVIVSRSGVCAGVSECAVDRPVARGHSERDRCIDHADGAGIVARRDASGKSAVRGGRGGWDCDRDATDVDELATAMDAVVHRVIC